MSYSDSYSSFMFNYEINDDDRGNFEAWIKKYIGAASELECVSKLIMC